MLDKYIVGIIEQIYPEYFENLRGVGNNNRKGVANHTAKVSEIAVNVEEIP